MAESTENGVALFIDWDNLAISTAADLGGATPDVKRIVQKAQEYGKILVARAYAEWNTMSERLSVYRAGVEPVYAPTFRFETDPITQASRGKSLADPVMVADCVDSLHILPQVSTYVIVTGDKDLIPVVRLAQLRGRRVVVIGPDYVAGVLRDMADDFISYRTLVSPNGEVAVAPAAPPRPREAGPLHRRPPARAPLPAKATPPKVAPSPPPRPAAVEEREPEAEPELPDLPGVFAALVDILNHMAATGRARVRATNLKDQLLVRIPGFSERKYGFTKFKDLLVAAERGGLISVSAVGPVHWVSLPEVAAPAQPAEAPVAATAAEAVAVAEAAPEDAEQAERARERRLAVVRFIDELRRRSRWLTYTYVLTNVIGFIGRLVPAGEAETEARSILNYLVAEGALRIDKVPQEVDVGGIKHRVRMCHFVEDHSIVAEARALSLEDLPPELAQELAPAAEPERPQEVTAEVVQPQVVEERATPAGEPSLELSDVVESTELAVPAEVAEAGGNGRVPEAADAEVASEEKAAAARSRRSRRRPRSAAPRQGTVEAEERAEAPTQAEPEAAETQGEQPSPEAGTAVAESEEAARPTLDEVFAEARRILLDLLAQGKARVTGSSLKLRLSRAFPGFDERQYGFGKFKDFLKAAEQAGFATVDVEGQVNWVRAPRTGEAEPTPAAVERESLPAEPAAAERWGEEPSGEETTAAPRREEADQAREPAGEMAAAEEAPAVGEAVAQEASQGAAEAAPAGEPEHRPQGSSGSGLDEEAAERVGE